VYKIINSPVMRSKNWSGYQGPPIEALMEYFPMLADDRYGLFFAVAA